MPLRLNVYTDREIDTRMHKTSSLLCIYTDSVKFVSDSRITVMILTEFKNYTYFKKFEINLSDCNVLENKFSLLIRYLGEKHYSASGFALMTRTILPKIMD